MTKQTNITATEARFPLASLTLSPINPRQTVPEVEIVELADSIWTVGLIQSIAGLADDKGGAEIVAGGRRLRALQYLAEQHDNLASIRPELANPLVMIAPDVETRRHGRLRRTSPARTCHLPKKSAPMARWTRPVRPPLASRARLP